MLPPYFRPWKAHTFTAPFSFIHVAIEDHLEVTDYLLDLGKTDIHNLGLTLGLHHHHLKTMGDSETFRNDMVDAWLQKKDQVLKRGTCANMGESSEVP